MDKSHAVDGENRPFKYDNPIRELTLAIRYLLEALTTNVLRVFAKGEEYDNLLKAERGALAESLSRVRATDRALTARWQEVDFLVKHGEPLYPQVEVEEVQQRESERQRLPRGK